MALSLALAFMMRGLVLFPFITVGGQIIASGRWRFKRDKRRESFVKNYRNIFAECMSYAFNIYFSYVYIQYMTYKS